MANLRARSRRCRADLAVYQDCKSHLSNDNWTPSMQKYGRYICGPCWSSRQRTYSAADPNHAEKQNARRRAREAGWSAERKVTERRRRYNYWLQHAYGISLDEYDKILDEQESRCGLCRTVKPRGRGAFHVDHCHESGLTRGLLCAECNMMLGLAKDDPAVLRRAADYIDLHAQRLDHKLDARKAAGGKAY